MNQLALRLTLLGVLSLGISGCEIVGGIFRIGFWAGIILVLLVVVAIWGLLRLLS